MVLPPPLLPQPDDEGDELNEFTPVVSVPPLETPGLLKIEATDTGDDPKPKTPVLSGSLVDLGLIALIGLVDNNMAIVLHSTHILTTHTLTTYFVFITYLNKNKIKLIISIFFLVVT